MAGKPKKLTVSYTVSALKALDEIWSWNAARYNRNHARRYIEFLKTETGKLETTYLRGRVIPERPELHFVTIRRQRKGYGHVAIYEVIGNVVQILDYFHTSQNWKKKLSEEE